MAWYQGSAYNDLCPFDNVTFNFPVRCPVGCVATAMSQIINYWGSLKGLPRSVSFSSSDNYLSEIKNKAGNSVSIYIDATEANIHQILYPADEYFLGPEISLASGYSVKTNYCAEGSGAYHSDVISALPDKFGYDQDIELLDPLLNIGLYDKIKNNIQQGWPVMLSIYNDGGLLGQAYDYHSIVCDGYKEDENGTYYHLNIGWGVPFQNTFYNLPEFRVLYTNREFNVVRNAVINIHLDGGNIEDINPPIDQIQQSSIPTLQSLSLTSSYGKIIVNDMEDWSKPIEALFKFCESPTGSIKGKSSGWSENMSYTDSDLDPNNEYIYEVYARDSSPLKNETPASEKIKIVTKAVVPNSLIINNTGFNTAILQIAPDNNPTYTEYAIYNKTNNTWITDTGTESSSKTWKTKSQWGDISVINLQSNSEYEFQVLARNLDFIETDLSQSIVVSTLNSIPVLSDANLSQNVGNSDTEFTYSIKYSDHEGEAPTKNNIYINGVRYTLKKISGDFGTGATFEFTTKLTSGSYDYYFEFSDGTTTVRYPENGILYGPTVSDEPTYSIVSSPSTRTIDRGETAEYEIEIIPLNGFNSSVTLSATQLPSNATASIMPNPVAISTKTIIKINTNKNTLIGSNVIKINGSGGGITQSININLNINDAKPILLSNSVTPYYGDPGESYKFEVIYKDFEGQLPTKHILQINGKDEFVMDYVSGDAETGVIYNYSNNLGFGNFSHSFIFSDGKNEVILGPNSGPYVGINPSYNLTVNPDRKLVQPGQTIEFDIGIQANYGYMESVDLNVSNIPPGISSILSLTTITGFGNSLLTLQTSESTETGEFELQINADDGNIKRNKNIKLLIYRGNIPGDIDGNCVVNIFDIQQIAVSYNSVQGDDRYNSDLDLDENGIINIFDIQKVAVN